MTGADTAIRVRELDVAYGRIRALHGVSLDIPAGKMTALVGANGAGKSTLLQAILGLVPLQSGSVEIPAGADVAKLSAERRVHDLGLVLVPEGRSVFGEMTVEENLGLGLRVGRARAADGGAQPALDEAYAMFSNLHERRRTKAKLLSGGEQQMLAIARSLLMRPRVLLIDEPSMGLAPLVVAQIFETLAGHLDARGITCVLVEQDAELALRLSDVAYVLERGRIELSGTAAEVAASPRLRAAYLGLEPQVTNERG